MRFYMETHITKSERFELKFDTAVAMGISVPILTWNIDRNSN